MPSVFENLSDGFYTAFFEPDAEKRKTAIEAWAKAAALVIRPAVEEDLKRYLNTILTKDLDTPRGYQMRAEKFNRIMDTHRLCLDISLRQREGGDTVVEALSPEVRARTIEAAKKALPEVKPPRRAQAPGDSLAQNADDDDYDDPGHDHSSNDDRSDSMNPNNDDYQASADNRSDQMNPNNDAYWSSRGR